MYKYHFKLVFLTLLSGLTKLTTSFLFPQDAVHPKLGSYAKAQKDLLLQVNFDLSHNGQQAMSHLYINDLQLELTHDPPANNHVTLPGANGPRPHLSTGPLNIITRSHGFFVSLKGKEFVTLEEPCWEMVWQEGRHPGYIVLGFQVPQIYTRNDASLFPGRIYLNFSIWTKEGLDEIRNDKNNHDKLVAKYQDEQDGELVKMKETNNPLMKAFHFRNAAAANEKLSLTKNDRYTRVPMTGEDTIEVGDGLLLCNKGTVWKKGGQAFLGTTEHVLLGFAVIKRAL